MRRRTILRLAPLACVALAASACGGSAPDAAADDTVVLAVEGMVCDSCEEGITHELQKIEGVRACAVDHERGRAEVTYAPSLTDPAALIAAINGLGYHASVTDERPGQAAASAAAPPPASHP